MIVSNKQIGSEGNEFTCDDGFKFFINRGAGFRELPPIEMMDKHGIYGLWWMTVWYYFTSDERFNGVDRRDIYISALELIDKGINLGEIEKKDSLDLIYSNLNNYDKHGKG